MSDEKPGVAEYEQVMAWARGCPGCRRLQQELAEAREVARECYDDLGYMGEYLFQKHYGDYLERYPWLKRVTTNEP
jgi:hypothetical protein